uniref:Solute carrier family 14 member 1 (Kidd blood group) n=1 Tax=Rousettus aegyptiacus TaxID=9407 RepID=A0A7J8DKX0_ROUAE|nr:solute carrier family 14 member 1 (Kidd blood group) [Rousettus aegyptiacus]
MNGPSLIDSAGRAPPGPLSRDPFGNKAGEAARGGFLQLKRALTGGPPQQVSNCSRPAWLQCHPGGNTHGCLFKERRLFLVALIPCIGYVHDLSTFLKCIEHRVVQMGPPCLHPALQHGAVDVPFSHGTLQSILPKQIVHACKFGSQCHLV